MWVMDDGNDIERRDCIRRLFAVLTAKLEDAAALAAEGQGRRVLTDTVVELSGQMHEIAGQSMAIAEASCC